MKLFQFKKQGLFLLVLFFIFSLSVECGSCQENSTDIISSKRIIMPADVVPEQPTKAEVDYKIDDEIVDPVINPATKYCTELGYQWEKKTTDEGEVGMCVMPDGEKIEEWGFTLGQSGSEWSYCERKGYKMEIVEDAEKCKNILSEKCAVCIRADGVQLEVTQLLESDIENNTVAVLVDKEQAKAKAKVLALVLLFTIITVLIIFAYFLLLKEKHQEE